MAFLVKSLQETLQKPFGIGEYLLWSTAAIPLMLVTVARIGIDVMLGYPLILINCLILLTFDKLRVHRNHLIAISALSIFSLTAGMLAGTPFTAQVAQIVGISVFSIYFFSALTILGPSIPRWLDMYARIAFGVAVYGIVLWAVEKFLHIGDGRLKAIYAEPSHFIYTTLPAVGYFINSYIANKRYGPEAAIMILSYLLAASSLGFLGLLLIGAFAFGSRLKGWRTILGILLICGFAGGLYVASSNVRLRANDMVLALSTQDVSRSNSTTFAFLSNAFVSSQVFLAHPMTGVGIGGYNYVYDNYIADLTGIRKTDPSNIDLNRLDANSLFLRVAAELGAPGLIVLFGFLIICGRVKGLPYQTIRNALLPYLIVRMWRYGAYFSVELYFFVGLYLFNYLNYRLGIASLPPVVTNGRTALLGNLGRAG